MKTTYKLESDGPVIFKCYEIISTLTASIHFPNISALESYLVVAVVNQQPFSS